MKIYFFNVDVTRTLQKTYENTCPFLKEVCFNVEQKKLLYLNEKLEKVSVRNKKPSVNGINDFSTDDHFDVI
jgi:hypothetical protein